MSSCERKTRFDSMPRRTSMSLHLTPWFLATSQASSPVVWPFIHDGRSWNPDLTVWAGVMLAEQLIRLGAIVCSRAVSYLPPGRLVRVVCDLLCAVSAVSIAVAAGGMSCDRPVAGRFPRFRGGLSSSTVFCPRRPC
ncbi:hypothetical protein FKP32DRAFT_1288339 [Trametes sanguinea]|nr:hypothetical protein FKP32DRAFT_1288339 [Trametes sanguinea]